MTPEDTSLRRPVWIALSELFLDTDVSLVYDSIAETLAASPYTLAELTSILENEVAPVVYPNLLSVAGEWVGFDPGWLEGQITNAIGRRRWTPFRGSVLKMIGPDWQAVQTRVEHLRRSP